MTPKEYLSQIRKLKLLIEQRQKELDLLAEKNLSALSGIDYSRISVKGARSGGAPFEQTAIKAADLGEEVATLIRKYTDLQHKIIGEIQALDRPEYMQVLYARYVENKRLEEIAHEMNYDYNYIRRLHGRALQAFGKLEYHTKEVTQSHI